MFLTIGNHVAESREGYRHRIRLEIQPEIKALNFGPLPSCLDHGSAYELHHFCASGCCCISHPKSLTTHNITFLWGWEGTTSIAFISKTRNFARLLYTSDAGVYSYPRSSNTQFILGNIISPRLWISLDAKKPR